MSIIYDSNTNGTTVLTTSISWTHVTANNTYLLVFLYGQAGTIASTTCTYNSVSMAQLGYSMDNANYNGVAAFGLYVSTGGSFSVSGSWPSQGGSLNGASSSWTGVDSGTSSRTPIVGKGSGGTPASVVVSNAVSGDMVVDGTNVYNTTGAIVQDGSQDPLFEETRAAGNPSTFGSSNKAAAGSTTMTWTGTFSTEWVDIGVALVPAPAGTPGALLTEPGTGHFQKETGSGNIALEY